MDFFNQTITRLTITSFMDFFAQFSVEKLGTIPMSASGDSVFVQRKIIPVPIQYATREKWVEIVRSSAGRKQMNPTERDKNPVEMQWILPRISCNITGISYDANRKLIKTQQVSDYQGGNSATSTYSPASYNLEVEISTIARHIDDNLQLMEQILPYFAPAMNMSLHLYSDTTTESVPIILNSVSMDNPVDIPEFEERVFINTYNFTIKLNYFVVKKLRGVITGIGVTMRSGQDVVEISKTWLAAQQKINTTFNTYLANADKPNPLVLAQTPASEQLMSAALSALGEPCVVITFIGNNQASLSIPSVSGTPYAKLFNIYYRVDSNMDIKKYTEPIDVNFTNIYFWIVFSPSPETDATQLEILSWGVNPFGIGEMQIGSTFVIGRSLDINTIPLGDMQIGNTFMVR